jgi:hypothetical protein
MARPVGRALGHSAAVLAAFQVLAVREVREVVFLSS